MKKALQKLTGSKKVGKVLSKTSNSSQGSSECQTEQIEELEMNKETTESLFSQEIDSLKAQVEELKQALGGLQSDLERKDLVIGKLAREKEKISLDLIKQKRSNCSILQQLEDERNYYYKEKEIYCQEMNEMKKLKKNMSESSFCGSVEDYKSTIEKLKESLNQTLEANYNLSIKFLRMKNTKTCLKAELKRLQLDHEKIVIDLRSRIDKLNEEVDVLVKDRMAANISPSSKKYLQLVKRNSCLLYENLNLQLEVDQLALKMDKQALHEARIQRNSMLQYIKHSRSSESKSTTDLEVKKRSKSKKVRIKDEQSVKSEKQKKLTKKRSSGKEFKIVKIFEREELPGVPNIQIVDGSATSSKSTQVLILPKTESNQEKLSKIIQEMNSIGNEEKLTLLQVSEVQSQASSDFIDCNSSYSSQKKDNIS